MKRIYARETVCIGCRLCEVYCVAEHTPSRNLIKAFRRGSKPIAAVRVLEEGALSFAVQCRHCEHPECVDACITGALRFDDRNVAVVDAASCIGCWTCVLACTYGAIARDEAQRRSVKCDLCPGEEIPTCVAMCPNGALSYSDTPPDHLLTSLSTLMSPENGQIPGSIVPAAGTATGRAS